MHVPQEKSHVNMQHLFLMGTVAPALGFKQWLQTHVSTLISGFLDDVSDTVTWTFVLWVFHVLDVFFRVVARDRVQHPGRGPEVGLGQLQAARRGHGAAQLRALCMQRRGAVNPAGCQAADVGARGLLVLWVLDAELGRLLGPAGVEPVSSGRAAAIVGQTQGQCQHLPHVSSQLA